MPIKINGTNTAANPSITGSDTDTGIVYGSDQIDFSIGGASKVTIDSSGNVGIGDTSPTAALSVAATAPDIAIGQAGSTRMKIGYEGNNCFFGATASTGLFVFKQNVDLEGHPQASGTERMRITSDGQLLVGTSSANDTREMLRIKNTSGDGTFLTIEAPSDTGSCHIFFGDSDFNEGRISYLHSSNKMTFTTNDAERMEIDSSGNIGAPSGSNIYNASDQRLKKNIVTLDKGLTSINSLRPVSFNWIDGFCDAEKETLYGFIAQEVQNVDPNLISQFGSNGTVEIGEEKIENPLRVNEKFITPILVKAIQELSAKVTTLETENAKLQTDLTSLTARGAALEAA